MTEIQISNSSTELNFEVDYYVAPTQTYKILLDFIETFSVGDIFLATLNNNEEV